MTDTSDDVLGLGGGTDIPSVRAGNLKKTAKPVTSLTDEQKRKRQQQAAFSTSRLEPPKLGRAGLLGVNVSDIGAF